jgi:hypothetical protein
MLEKPVSVPLTPEQVQAVESADTSGSLWFYCHKCAAVHSWKGGVPTCPEPTPAPKTPKK